MDRQGATGGIYASSRGPGTFQMMVSRVYTIDSVETSAICGEDKFVQSTLFENLRFIVSARRTVERLFLLEASFDG
jgi:hypothetical protein